VLFELGGDCCIKFQTIYVLYLILKKRSVGLKVVVSLHVTRDFIEEALKKFQINLNYL